VGVAYEKGSKELLLAVEVPPRDGACRGSARPEGNEDLASGVQRAGDADSCGPTELQPLEGDYSSTDGAAVLLFPAAGIVGAAPPRIFVDVFSTLPSAAAPLGVAVLAAGTAVLQQPPLPAVVAVLLADTAGDASGTRKLRLAPAGSVASLAVAAAVTDNELALAACGPSPAAVGLPVRSGAGPRSSA
jgi:hypothetical protein